VAIKKKKSEVGTKKSSEAVDSVNEMYGGRMLVGKVTKEKECNSDERGRRRRKRK
jgi:hypothetical protein